MFRKLVLGICLSACGSTAIAQPVNEYKGVSVTAATTTTTTTTVAPVVFTDSEPEGLTVEERVALARQVHGVCGEYRNMALAVGWPAEEWPRLNYVMWRESRCNFDAWNGHDAGLMQINEIHSAWLGDMGWQHPADMFVPEFNLTFAYRLWETSGWRPWGFKTDDFKPPVID